MASAARPDSPGKFEIESADDFVPTGSQTSIKSATFTGLLTGGATRRVLARLRSKSTGSFQPTPDVDRTSGAPTFSTAHVPTRVNSPSDVAFRERSTTAGNLSVTTTVLSPMFTACNSVQPGGIHPLPSQTTGGNGPITGQEVQFHITFTTPFNLPPDHYFFVPQVQVNGGEFLWLSGTRPIPPFPPGSTDLQSWTRDDDRLNPIGSASERTSLEEVQHRQHLMPLSRSMASVRSLSPQLCPSSLVASARWACSGGEGSGKQSRPPNYFSSCWKGRRVGGLSI